HPDYIHDCLLEEDQFVFKGNSKIIFPVKNVIAENYIKTKKKNSRSYTRITFHLKTNVVKIDLEQEKAEWLMKMLSEYSIEGGKKVTLQQLKTKFEGQFEDFELFWFSKPLQQLREN